MSKHRRLIVVLFLSVMTVLGSLSLSGCFVRARGPRCAPGKVVFRAKVRACARPGVRRWVRVCAPNRGFARAKAKAKFRRLTRRPCAVIVPGSLRRN